MRIPDIRFPFAVASVVLAASAGLAARARADGPLPRSLVPPPAAAAADSIAERQASAARALEPGPDDAASVATGRAPSGRRTSIRRVAFLSGVGLAAIAVWRSAVADDREKEYDRAIFSSSAAALRRKVRDAEGESNFAGALAGAAFSVSLLTFVY